MAGLIDSFIFNSRKKLTGSNAAEGFGGRQGKMVSPRMRSADIAP